jgi:ribosomal protein L37AE/L43A
MPRTPVNPFVEYKGEKYYRDKRDGYYKTSRTRGRLLLHRTIWEDEHEQVVPPGWHVHHIDHDRGNNDGANLAALPAGDHHRKHITEDGPRGAFADPFGVRSAKRKDEWRQRKPRKYTCAECGSEYTSRSNKPTFYCSRQCCDRAMHRRRAERARERRAAGL